MKHISLLLLASIFLLCNAHSQSDTLLKEIQIEEVIKHNVSFERSQF